MKISTRGRYALRLMIDLAQNKEQGNISLKDVAKRQEISIKYLEQIATPLIRAGLIKSVRGAQGGYSLTRDINKYNDVKSFFSCVLEYNELKENYLESKVIKLVSCKRTFGSVTKNLFIDNYKINKYTQVHLFIYFITIFDNAFNGNVEYKYIKNLYKEFAKELNDSPLLENKK